MASLSIGLSVHFLNKAVCALPDSIKNVHRSVCVCNAR
jgi:hypothetical protein